MSERDSNPDRIALPILAGLATFIFVMGCGSDDDDDSRSVSAD